jgi:hypothetical protein
MQKMEKFRGLLAVAATASCLICAEAHAAHLTAVQGEVFISRAGGPFQPVTGPTEVAQGDVVKASPGSSAQVVQANGQILTVNSASPMTIAETIGQQIPTASATVDGLSPPSGTETLASATGGGVGPAALVAGGVAVGVGAYVVQKTIAAKKTSASP